jgi:hypothetical protein
MAGMERRRADRVRRSDYRWLLLSHRARYSLLDEHLTADHRNRRHCGRSSLRAATLKAAMHHSIGDKLKTIDVSIFSPKERLPKTYMIFLSIFPNVSALFRS